MTEQRIHTSFRFSETQTNRLNQYAKTQNLSRNRAVEHLIETYADPHKNAGVGRRHQWVAATTVSLLSEEALVINGRMKNGECVLDTFDRPMEVVEVYCAWCRRNYGSAAESCTVSPRER